MATMQSPAALRILVVDDDPDGTAAMAMLLRIYGCEVRVALDGRTALATAFQEPPDVALLDLGMPILDGCELACLLRANPITHSVWLLAVTGYGQDADRRRAAEAGFDHFLLKPVDPQDLLAVLARCRASRPAQGGPGIGALGNNP
jgi:CheY-like chemotaxis protein